MEALVGFVLGFVGFLLFFLGSKSRDRGTDPGVTEGVERATERLGDLEKEQQRIEEHQRDAERILTENEGLLQSGEDRVRRSKGLLDRIELLEREFKNQK